jgi:hypothetical protein
MHAVLWLLRVMLRDEFRVAESIGLDTHMRKFVELRTSPT